MKKKTLINGTTVILLIATIICAGTGIVKWPGLINALGLTYRDLPMALLTELHDWTGLVMLIFAGIHLAQFRRRMMRMLTINSVRNQS
jgi:hypothetical protein